MTQKTIFAHVEAVNAVETSDQVGRAEPRDAGLWKAVSKSGDWAAVVAKIITGK